MGLIFLTGLPGVGKTTVGALLAEALQYRFVDLDEEIERSAGKSIARIFAEDGESSFRDQESVELSKTRQLKDAVVALGAGALERDRNFEEVMSSGTVVCLSVPLDRLAARVHAQNRPLLTGTENVETTKQRLLELYQRRRARYESAHLVLVIDAEMTAAQAARELLEALTVRERA